MVRLVWSLRVSAHRSSCESWQHNWPESQTHQEDVRGNPCPKNQTPGNGCCYKSFQTCSWNGLPEASTQAISSIGKRGSLIKSIQERVLSNGGIGDLPVTAMRGSLFLEHERQFESRIPSSGISFYGQDPALPTVHSSSGLCRSAVPIAQTMQIPFSYAAAIVGIGGAHTFVGLVEPP
ncbi:hypothetical protein V6N13_004363 [Hibiscus sabdariffa]|uniref:Uncharacterized protein n=1 Tax=Hibiscus sabdariffa TaxID=183260 RepID=A0ABR2RYK0_9ROSI